MGNIFQKMKKREKSFAKQALQTNEMLRKPNEVRFLSKIFF